MFKKGQLVKYIADGTEWNLRGHPDNGDMGIVIAIENDLAQNLGSWVCRVHWQGSGERYWHSSNEIEVINDT